MLATRTYELEALMRLTGLALGRVVLAVRQTTGLT